MNRYYFVSRFPYTLILFAMLTTAVGCIPTFAISVLPEPTSTPEIIAAPTLMPIATVPADLTAPAPTPNPQPVVQASTAVENTLENTTYVYTEGSEFIMTGSSEWLELTLFGEQTYREIGREESAIILQPTYTDELYVLLDLEGRQVSLAQLPDNEHHVYPLLSAAPDFLFAWDMEVVEYDQGVFTKNEAGEWVQTADSGEVRTYIVTDVDRSILDLQAADDETVQLRIDLTTYEITSYDAQQERYRFLHEVYRIRQLEITPDEIIEAKHLKGGFTKWGGSWIEITADGNITYQETGYDSTTIYLKAVEVEGLTAEIDIKRRVVRFDGLKRPAVEPLYRILGTG